MSNITGVDEIDDIYYDANVSAKPRGALDYQNPTAENGSSGVWFKCTSDDSLYNISTCASVFDMKIIVLNDCPTNLGQIIAAENDNLAFGDTTGGQTLYCLAPNNDPQHPVIHMDSTGGDPGSTVVTNYLYLSGASAAQRGPFNLFITPDFADILPVEWLYFEGSERGSVNELRWATASEINNSHFLIEKSVDGENFTTLAKVPGAGNSAFENRYNILDTQPYTESFYRISQIDYDGTKDSYKTIYLKRTASFTIYELVNERGTGHLSFAYNKESDAPIQLTLYSVKGEKVAEDILYDENGIYRLNSSGLKAGIYLLNAVNNQSQISLKIFIQ